MKLAIVALAATAAAFAQDTQRVFHFTNLTSPSSFQEVTNIFRTVADIKSVTPDSASQTVTATADATKLGILDWLAPLLDVPSGATTAPLYQVPGTADDVVSVLYVPGAQTPAALQELINVIRTGAHVNRVFPLNTRSAIVVRGPSERVALSTWLATQLLSASSPSPAQFLLSQDIPRYPAKRIHLYFLKTARSPQAMQELVNVARNVADLNRVFPFNQTHAIMVRGNDEQIALADWLISALDKTPPGTGVASEHITIAVPYPDPATEERVFYLPAATAAADMQQLINRIRLDSGIRRISAASTPAAIAMRGDASQIAKAGEILEAAQH